MPAQELTAENLPSLAHGCGVLGAGGGGTVSLGLSAALQAIEQYGPVRLLDLDEVPDDELVMPIGVTGAPTISVEKPCSGFEAGPLRDRMEELTGRKVAAFMPFEIGGANGCEPIAWAAQVGLPVVDADGMGRAFPHGQMKSMNLAGIDPAPGLMVDERGNLCELWPSSPIWGERMSRAIAVSLGGQAVSSSYVMNGVQARTAAVRGSVTLAMRIGDQIAHAQSDPIAELMEMLGGASLITGKIVDVQRNLIGGWDRGYVTIEGLREDVGRTMRLEIRNENLVAIEDGAYRAMVPDIITVLETQTAEAVTTELLRYGQRVTAVAFPCDDVWRTQEGIRIAGPRAFGYDLDFVPIESISKG